MRFLLSVVLGCVVIAPALAQESSPALVSAIQLADQGDYPAAVEQVGPADVVGRDLLTWLQLRNGDGDFADYAAFLKVYADWPGLSDIRQQAERAIPKEADPAIVVDFFDDAPPETGLGAVRLAEALMRQGALDRARSVVVAAWTDLSLTANEQAAMLAGFADIIAPHHATRTDTLLWRWRTEEAEAMLPLLDAGQAALAKARIAYINNDGVAQAAAAVPAPLRNSAGLDYDRYSWLAGRGNNTEAISVLKARSTSAEALQEPFRWSGWRRSLARWEMREGRAQSAYEVAANHFLTEGGNYADLEWIAGYVALRYLGDPTLALTHFQNMAAAVDSPISSGRAGYWLGRTYAALGDANAAAAAFAQGAKHQTSFYGLLAAEQLGMRLDPSLTGRADMVNWADSNILGNRFVIAGLALLEAGERGHATTFFAHLGQELDAAGIGQLAKLMEDRDDPFYAVLLGKAAATRGIIVPSAYFPLHDLAEMDLPIEPALALSIARRESEFNFRAGSPVGALGLMQLMPATAEEVAGFLNLPYARARLTRDWQYNAQLGSEYLRLLQEQFGPSPVQIAAGYNAGPSRPLAWMADRGDPRLGDVDVIDWIEHIPFRETRDYVMRVTESIPVYRARLTGQTRPVNFTSLLMGEKPIVRPQLRPVPVARADDAPIAAPPRPSAPEPVQAVRPLPRPGN